MTDILQPIAPVAAAAKAKPRDRRYLFGPIIDFLTMGGGSLIALAVIAFLLDPTSHIHQVAAVMAIVAHVINNPHFIHSYQLFYTNYRGRISRANTSSILRFKYIFAGIVVPLILVSYFLFSLLTYNARLLGYGANIMFIFVGWHYAKQGYGLLMVDAVMKKRFFKAFEKRLFVTNAYVVWAYTWIKSNQVFYEANYWGVKYFMFDLPEITLTLGFWAMIGMSTLLLLAMVARLMRREGLPVNGLLAYIAALYMWLIIVTWNPLFAYFTPAFHSLQYLAVVWRFKLNSEKAADNAAGTSQKPWWQSIWARLGAFAGIGVFAGYLAFWGLPQIISASGIYNENLIGGQAILFAFIIFINVHHYFMDNVIWRKDNPEIKTHLFGSK